MVVDVSTENTQSDKTGKPSLKRQIFPAVALTVAGVGFISVLDNPGGSGQVALEGVLGTVATLPNASLPETSSTQVVGVDPMPVESTLAPSPTTTVNPSVGETGSPVKASECNGDVVTGPTAVFKWGEIQLEATFTKKNVLCNVVVLSYPNDDDRTLLINQRALPVYNQEAVAANSAMIAAVSGATDSWTAYTAGLQAILDSRT